MDQKNRNHSQLETIDSLNQMEKRKIIIKYMELQCEYEKWKRTWFK